MHPIKLDFMWPTIDPFLFCVHHKDHYPPGNGKLGLDADLSDRMLGNDFQLKDGFRMYHGRSVPGFPAHPHRGFETITIVEEGFVDHADSYGCAGRYGQGDVQWMSAGKGLQHSEMFPLIQTKSDNPVELFQIWLNLPAAKKLAEPQFVMHWSEQIPKLSLDQGRVKLKIIAGSYQGQKALAPPPISWAAQEGSDVAIYLIEIRGGGCLSLEKASDNTSRKLYCYSGDSVAVGQGALSVNYGTKLGPESLDIRNDKGNITAKLLLLQGRAIGEPVVQHGPFVMNKPEEIMQAFSDYQRTEFGGWPWPSPEQAHGSSEGRFAKFIDGSFERPKT